MKITKSELVRIYIDFFSSAYFDNNISSMTQNDIGSKVMIEMKKPHNLIVKEIASFVVPGKNLFTDRDTYYSYYIPSIDFEVMARDHSCPLMVRQGVFLKVGAIKMLENIRDRRDTTLPTARDYYVTYNYLEKFKDIIRIENTKGDKGRNMSQEDFVELFNKPYVKMRCAKDVSMAFFARYMRGGYKALVKSPSGGVSNLELRGKMIYRIVPQNYQSMSMLNTNKLASTWFYCYTLGFMRIDNDSLNFLHPVRGVYHLTCPKCHKEYVSASELDNPYCPKCALESAICSECGKIGPIEEYTATRDHVLCKECSSRPRCRCCGSTLDKGSKEVVCNRCKTTEGIFSYHSGAGRRDESEGSRFRVGLEVEKEDSYYKPRIRVGEICEVSGWIAERDGSLSDCGYELISPIYPLDPDKIKEKMKPILHLINSKCTNRCGGHIHVSDRKRTPYQILTDIKGYLPLLYSMYPSRARNCYCEAKETNEYLQRGHRQALNISDNTLEFRIFPAVQNADQLLFRIELVKYMLEHPERDVQNVGNVLLDTSSGLYKLLRKRVHKESLDERAVRFADFSSLFEGDMLMVENGKMSRVLKFSKIKLQKEKELDETVARLSNNITLGEGSGTVERMFDTRGYGLRSSYLLGDVRVVSDEHGLDSLVVSERSLRESLGTPF